MTYSEEQVMAMLNKAAEMTDLEIQKYHEAYGAIIKARDEKIGILTEALDDIMHHTMNSYGYKPNKDIITNCENYAREALKKIGDVK